MTYVGTEDVVINENTCDAASAGTTTVTLTNANGCEYTETTIVTYVGTEDVAINETTCNAASAGTTSVTLTNSNGCEE
ncbi:MAG: hypothetical protein R2753_11875 [Chitinophagales bacterium]